jgi:transcriptional antiterminator NusG
MTYWTAAHTEPRIERKVRSGIEALDRGACLPTFVHGYVFRGRLRRTEHPIIKNYVLIALKGIEDDAWSAINHVEGVHRVLTNNGKPSRVSEEEVADLVLAHATGAYNRIQSRSASGHFEKRRTRRARPRKGKVARSSTYLIGQRSDGMCHAS